MHNDEELEYRESSQMRFMCSTEIKHVCIIMYMCLEEHAHINAPATYFSLVLPTLAITYTHQCVCCMYAVCIIYVCMYNNA